MHSEQGRSFDDEDGVRVYFDVYAPTPEGTPSAAAIQLAHGVGEHAGRYRELATHLAAAGYAVYADDHLGHGRTGMEQWEGDATRLGRLGPGGLRAAIRDVHAFSDLIRAENPDLPLVYVGHSWGSLIGQIVLNRHSDEYDGMVLSGTAYRALGSMNGGDLNKRHAHLGTTGAEWLSRDPAVAQAFVDDPLTTLTPLQKLFGMVDAARLLGRPARNLAHDLPVLIQVGSDDPLGGPVSARRLEQAYRTRSHLSDVTTIVYEGARHEIFNETNRAEVFADLTAWLTQRVPARD
ncbi:MULTISPECIES: alpha/beta hydrolase [unclassified Leifsonia]|uniref:alpha/beta hydrolase n=1 Tax=unclassified Leifsonia TaxID=2663824 RepID=UPI0003776840|nr:MULTISPECIES: alpha/beta fold hydrolase [unclassified Leifsonia]TDQ02053.1 alpha-beta hydrolase superfamily lysophospholipase [Leifsonia sp. 115AMFTsu3.1]